MTTRKRDQQIARKLQKATSAAYQTCLTAVRNELSSREAAGASFRERQTPVVAPLRPETAGIAGARIEQVFVDEAGAFETTGLVWTSEKPTREGPYWVRRDFNADDAWAVVAGRGFNGELVMYDEEGNPSPLSEAPVDYQWFGPWEAPK